MALPPLIKMWAKVSYTTLIVETHTVVIPLADDYTPLDKESMRERILDSARQLRPHIATDDRCSTEIIFKPVEVIEAYPADENGKAITSRFVPFQPALPFYMEGDDEEICSELLEKPHTDLQ